MTDANVMVGKLQPRYFPKVFGANADEPLSFDAVQAQFDALAAQTGRAPEAVAEGFISSRCSRWPTRSRKYRWRAAMT